MSSCKFIRVEAWAREGPHKKNSKHRKQSAAGILAELIRALHACPHLADPKPPEILYGSDPAAVWNEAYAQAEQAVDKAGAKLKSTALIIVAGVVSYPVARSIVEENLEQRATFERWRKASMTWLHKEFGAHLKLIVGHHDETYPHLHFVALPALTADRRLHISDVHPGHRAEQQNRDAGGSRREQKQAHQTAMTAFQDRYYEDVAVAFGLARFGRKRQRLTRDEWKAQTKQLRALAAARDNLDRDRRHVAATAARLVVERAAHAQEEAAARVAAVEAAAAQAIEEAKRRAQNQIERLAAENGALEAEVRRRDALLLEATERLATLEALAAEQGLGPRREGS